MSNVKIEEEMEMPCLCDCGKWFDLLDGHPSKKSDKVVCVDCSLEEKKEADMEADAYDIAWSFNQGDIGKREFKKQLKALGISKERVDEIYKQYV